MTQNTDFASFESQGFIHSATALVDIGEKSSYLFFSTWVCRGQISHVFHQGLLEKRNHQATP